MARLIENTFNGFKKETHQNSLKEKKPVKKRKNNDIPP
jgi:hypothetical protein